MYKTSDLCLTATLETIGIHISRVSVVKNELGKPKATFMFEESPDLDIAIKSFWDRKLKVEPKDFFTNLKGVKSRIYEA